jgi:hypothetical protein
MVLAYQGVTYKTREALDPGPLQVTTQSTPAIPILPIVATVALLSGLALLVIRGSRTVPAIGVSKVTTMPII